MDFMNISKKDVQTVLEQLPEDLLLKIISSLPLEEAIRTSILSRRWKNLYKYINNLQVKYTLNCSQPQVFRDRAACVMNTFLHHHKGDEIRQLDIQFRAGGYGETAQRVGSCILFALSRGVQELFVDCSPYNIPSSVFKSGSLIELRLTQCNIQIPSSIRLPKLKTLVLQHPIVSAADVGTIISNCPVLENLSILHLRRFIDLEKLDIPVISSHMRTLAVAHNGQISIDAPTLESLELQIEMPNTRKWQLGNFPSLTRLYLNFSGYLFITADELKMFLGKFHNVEHIKLSTLCVQELPKVKNLTPMMATRLELVISLRTIVVLQRIPKILSFFPKVKKLILIFNEADKIITGQKGWDSTKKFISKALQLQKIDTIELHEFISCESIPQNATVDFIWSTCEMKIELVRIVLESSTCLRKVSVTVSTGRDYIQWKQKVPFKLRLIDKLQSLKKVSPDAKISVH